MAAKNGAATVGGGHVQHTTRELKPRARVGGGSGSAGTMTRSLPLQLGASKATSKACASTATSSGASTEASSNDVVALPDLRGLLHKYDVAPGSSRPASLAASPVVADGVFSRSQSASLPMVAEKDGELPVVLDNRPGSSAASPRSAGSGRPADNASVIMDLGRSEKHDSIGIKTSEAHDDTSANTSEIPDDIDLNTPETQENEYVNSSETDDKSDPEIDEIKLPCDDSPESLLNTDAPTDTAESEKNEATELLFKDILDSANAETPHSITSLEPTDADLLPKAHPIDKPRLKLDSLPGNTLPGSLLPGNTLPGNTLPRILATSPRASSMPTDPNVHDLPQTSPAIPSSPALLSFQSAKNDLASPAEQEYSVDIPPQPQQERGTSTEPEKTPPTVDTPQQQYSIDTPLVAEPQSESGSSFSRRSSVDPSQQYRELHKPFSFPSFVAQLGNKDAAPIARYIRSFLVAFWKQGHTFTADQRIKVVRDFEAFIHEKFTLHEPFASMDALDLENSREGLEKLVMNRVHGLCFPPEVAAANAGAVPKAYARDIALDAEFADQLEKFSWVNGSHLDVADLEIAAPRQGPTFQDMAADELNKMNKYKAPRDKIICILNACKLIVLALRRGQHSTNADAFVPLLILVLFKAKCPHLISNMHYIDRFRGKEWLGHGETSYYLASLQGAIAFIQGLDERSLTISSAEFAAHMEAWDAHAHQCRAVAGNADALPAIHHETPSPSTRPREPLHNVQPRHAGAADANAALSPSNVILTSAEMLTRSISDFLTPSPPMRAAENQAGPDHRADAAARRPPRAPQPDHSATHDTTYRSLREMFPTIDEEIIHDIVYLHHGEIGACVDGCLQLTAEA